MNTNAITTIGPTALHAAGSLERLDGGARLDRLDPLDRIARAVGVALVSWSERAARRDAAQQRQASSALARTRELHDLRRAAHHDAHLIAARRDLGINQLLG